MTTQTLKTALTTLILILMMTLTAPVEAHPGNAPWTCHRLATTSDDGCGDPMFHDVYINDAMDFENNGANKALVTVTKYSYTANQGIEFSECIDAGILGLTNGLSTGSWAAPSTMTNGQYFVITWHASCEGLVAEKSVHVCIKDSPSTRSC